MIRFSFLHALLVLLTAYIASERGRRWWIWVILGLLFPLVSLILVLLLPTKQPEVPPPSQQTLDTHLERKKCPVCAKEAPYDAIYCPYCRSELNRPG